MANDERIEPGLVDLNLLYTFRTVCDAGGVGAAASRLGRSQPAISSRLRLLERDLGIRLFERAGRRIVLSAAGRAIAAEVGAVIEGVHRVVDRARATDSEPSGLLRVGALPTVSVYLLAPCLAGILAEHPGARLQIETGLTAAQLESVRAGRLDVVMGIGPPPERGLEVVPLGMVRPVLAVARVRRPRPAATVSVRALAGLPLVGYGQIGDMFFDEVWRFVEHHRLDQQIRLLVPHIQTLKELVRRNTGVCILPSYTLVEPELVARRVEGLDFAHPVWAAFRSSSRDMALVRLLIERLRASVPASLGPRK